MYKHVDGGKAAVCRFELDPRRAHESPAYALKKGLPLTFRVFFSPEASGELSTGMPELGVEISDFHDAQSVDCRLECTMVDKRGKVVHKSVCEQWTFERAKRERWSVRVAPSRLEAERKSGRLFADFRVEWKPPDWRKEEESVEMSPPTTFKLPLVNLQEVTKFHAHSFYGITFAVRYFPPPHESRAADIEFVVVRFDDRPFVRLHFEWTLRDAHQQPAVEHSETVDFNTCGCGRPCTCAHKRTKARFKVAGEALAAAARPLFLELRVREVFGNPPGVPPHFEWSVAHRRFVDPKSLPAVGPSTSSVQASDEPHSAATQPSSNFLPTARGDQPAPPLPSASRTNNGANLSALNQPIVLVPRPPSSFAPLPRFGVLSSEGQQSAATYRLDVIDTRETIRHATPRNFEDLRFVLLYFPPDAQKTAADFVFSLVDFPNGASVSLRLQWALLQTDGQPTFEHTIARHFVNCACRFSCKCPQKRTTTSYRLPATRFLPFVQANGLRLRLMVERWVKAAAPQIREELPEIVEISQSTPPPPVEVRGPGDGCPSPSGRRLWEARNRKRSAVDNAEVVCLSDDEEEATVRPENEEAASHLPERAGSSTHALAAELDQPPPKKKRAEDVVTIEAEGHLFVVDRQRLIAESEFFAQAVAANEGAERFVLDGITRPEMAAVCEWVERKRVDASDLNALFIVAKRLEMPALKDACIEAIKRAGADKQAATASLIFAVEEEDDELIHALSFLWADQSKAAALLNSPQLMDLLATRPAFSAKIYEVLFPQ